MKYLSIQQAAEKWGVSSRRVQQLCKSGAIDGAGKTRGRFFCLDVQGKRMHALSSEQEIE